MAIDEKDRYEIFQDYLDDLYKKEQDRHFQNSRESRLKIKELLISLQKKDQNIPDIKCEESSSTVEEDENKLKTKKEEHLLFKTAYQMNFL